MSLRTRPEPASRRLVTAAALLALLLTAVYANHFDNDFQFDDSHTIESNVFIRDLGNVPRFFRDARTTSSLPTNQAYRPVVTTLNALDYHLAGGLHPVVFHLHIFVEFLLLCVLLYFFFLKVFALAGGARPQRWVALLAVAFFAFHTATAETINYIIARSDGFSSLCVLAAFLSYLYGRGWRRHLAVVFFVAGTLAKPTTLMFAPLLAVYLLLERPSCLVAGEDAPIGATVARLVRASGLYFALGLALYLFVLSMYSASWTPGVTRPLDYLLTQLWVIAVYLRTFLLPTRLTADSDLALVTEVLDGRILLGGAVILLTLAVAAITVRRRATVPIAFGISWFYVALLPSSSIVPLSEVMNHHRTFFPYMGLVISVAWACALLWRRFAAERRGLRIAGICALVVLLSAHGYGTYRRNEVWDSNHSLWRDVTLKSPNNGRGLMNYGLSLMARGDVDAAIGYYLRARDTAYGNHAYLFVNLALAYELKNEQDKAEQHFRTSLRQGQGFAEPHYFYARWLFRQGRLDPARQQAARALAVSPAHAGARRLLAQIDASLQPRIAAAEQQARQSPSAESHLQLSLEYYRKGRYEASIAAARQALTFGPSAAAYNNICAANNNLGRWALAAQACERALEIDPDFALARNNLDWALARSPAPTQ